MRRSLAELERTAFDYRTPELREYAENARRSAISANKTEGQRRDSALRELIIAFHICRENNPEIWDGFVSTRLEHALARAQAEEKPR